MKQKIWLFQIPVVILFTFAFYVNTKGLEGDLDHPVLRDQVYHALRRLTGAFTDRKFRLRGPQPSKNKVVIVEVDSESLARVGRWPWHRDVTAALIDKTFQAGAKAVGLDIVFSEPDVRVQPELA